MAKILGLDIGEGPAKKPLQDSPKKVSINTTKREAGKSVDLNFKVDPEFKREFRTWAAAHDVTQKETLERAFALLKRHGV